MATHDNSSSSHSVLFVCLGNICRSPMAEIVMKALIQSRSSKSSSSTQHIWTIDSAGTASYHEGDSPDSRTVSTCKKYYPWFDSSELRARQIKTSDFDNFDYILVMDESNLKNVNSIRKNNRGKAQVKLLGFYDTEKQNSIVEDPYYGGMNGFEINFTQIKRSLEHFIKIVESS